MTIIAIPLLITLFFSTGTGVKCADENGQCSCNGLVRYGADGRYSHYVDVYGSIGCNNGVFGDPISGTAKACYCEDRETKTEFGARENGYCVLADGADQNSGVSKAPASLNINNADDCLSWCDDQSGLTGCEYIWGHSNAGCYAHRGEVSHGNGVAKHYCWISLGSSSSTNYYSLAAGTVCPIDHIIRDQAECWAAIGALGFPSTASDWVGTSSNIPQGCSSQTPSGTRHFETSTGGTGTGRENQIPICKSSDSGCSNNDAQARTMVANMGQTISGCADIASMCGMNPTLDATCCATCGGSSDGPAGEWTDWFNRDSPNSSGDWENRDNHGDVCAQDMEPIEAECRVVGSHTQWDYTGQNFHRSCGVDGLICKNNENSGNCQNYEVRYLCAVMGMPDYNGDGIPDMPCSSKAECDTIVASIDQLAEAFEGVTMRCYQSLCVPGGDAKVEGESCIKNKQCWQPGITCLPIGDTFGNAMECGEPRGQYGFCFDDKDCSGSLECANYQCSQPGLLGDSLCVGGWCLTETSVGEKATNAFSSLSALSWASMMNIFALVGFFSIVYTVGKNCFLVNEYVHITESEV